MPDREPSRRSSPPWASVLCAVPGATYGTSTRFSFTKSAPGSGREPHRLPRQRRSTRGPAAIPAVCERVLSGMARAKSQGKHCGRPKTAPEVERAIVATLRAGTGMIKTAKTHGVGVGTVQRLDRESRESNGGV